LHWHLHQISARWSINWTRISTLRWNFFSTMFNWWSIIASCTTLKHRYTIGTQWSLRNSWKSNAQNMQSEGPKDSCLVILSLLIRICIIY
jgi:hypothetical protein